MWSLWIYLFATCGVLHGAVHITSDIGCGQKFEGIASKGQIVSFQFTIDQQQDFQLVDTNNSFVPILKVKDTENRYIDSGFTTKCDQKECEGTIFTMKAVPRGVYTVEMIVDEDGNFQLDMICSIDRNDGMDVAEGTVLCGRHLLVFTVQHWCDHCLLCINPALPLWIWVQQKPQSDLIIPMNFNHNLKCIVFDSL